jgi:hypothetical protein
MLTTPYTQESAPDKPVRFAWVMSGCPIPPPAPVKHSVLAAYGAWSGSRIFVETGTYEGDTTHAMTAHYDTVYSFEASDPLYQAARKRFAGVSKVKLINADSAKAMAALMNQITQRAVFWLDAHWCGGQTAGAVLSSAIMGELEAIFAHSIKNHTIIIDDARYFVGEHGYPSVDYLRRWVASRRPEMVFDVAIDSIRIHAPNAGQNVAKKIG